MKINEELERMVQIAMGENQAEDFTAIEAWERIKGSLGLEKLFDVGAANKQDGVKNGMAWLHFTLPLKGISNRPQMSDLENAARTVIERVKKSISGEKIQADRQGDNNVSFSTKDSTIEVIANATFGADGITLQIIPVQLAESMIRVKH